MTQGMHNQLLTNLYNRKNRGLKLGLDRIWFLLEKIGNPQRNYPAIHIAGTNGKGAVSSMLAAIYTAAGYRTGLYTSPHLVHFTERIRIDGKPISEELLAEYLQPLLSYADQCDATFFEITTALAFWLFAEQQVDIAIIETGMGGRLDATNVLTPHLSIITSIGLDHVQQLGDTREKIAWEKAGIIKPAVPALVVDADLKAVFEPIAKERQSPLSILPECCHYRPVHFIGNGLYFRYSSAMYQNEQFFLPLLGVHQIQNAALAIKATELLQEEFPATLTHIRYGLENLRELSGYEARLHILRYSPLLIIDTAHNPSGVQASVTALRTHYPKTYKWNIVFAVMQDKDWESMLNYLRPLAHQYFLPQLPEERALPPHILAAFLGKDVVKVYESTKHLITDILTTSLPTLIIGSFYLAGALFASNLRKLLDHATVVDPDVDDTARC